MNARRRLARPPTVSGRYRIPNGSIESPTLSVYVIHWSAPEWCVQTVESLSSSLGIHVDVCVVDNGPATASERLRELLPDVRVIETGSNCGFTGAANIALEDWLSNSIAHVAAVASHDVRVDRASLEVLHRAMDSDQRLGIVGPGAGHLGSPLHESGRADPVIATPWISGSLMLMRRACVLDIGMFDEQFDSYVEDVDICYRAWDAGWFVGRVEGIVMGWNGTRDENARSSIEANWILLTLKRSGVAPALLQTAYLFASTLRNAVGMLLPNRSPDERTASRTRALQSLNAFRLARRRLRSQRSTVPASPQPEDRTGLQT